MLRWWQTARRVDKLEQQFARLAVIVAELNYAVNRNAAACNANFSTVGDALKSAAEAIVSLSVGINDAQKDDWWKQGENDAEGED